MACGRMRVSASCWLHSRASCGRTSWTAPGLRPLPTAQDRTVLCSAAPSHFSRPRVTSSRVPNCCIPRRGDRCRSDPHNYARSGARRTRLCPQSQACRHRGTCRNVDATQYERRRIAFDFDMIEYRWEQSLSPGNEQLFYWGSAAADQQGSRNYMGVKSMAVDAMIGAMLGGQPARISSPPPARSIGCCCRASMWCRFIFRPCNGWRRWARIAHPARTSLFGYLPETWWQNDLRP